MRACIWLHVGYDGGMFVRLRAVTSSWKIVLIFPELHQQFIKHATFTEGGGGVSACAVKMTGRSQRGGGVCISNINWRCQRGPAW